MIDILKQLQPNVAEEVDIQKKILCIIEGDLEFRYLTKIFKLFGYTKDCYSLSNEFIKIAWGNKLPKHENIVNEKCKFQGGSLNGRAVPFPAIDAFELYSRDLDIFDSVIVFFDGDKDKNSEVEEYFKEAFENLVIDNVLLVSIPCFESTLIDFCICGYCRSIVDYIPNMQYPCIKYKGHKKNKRLGIKKYSGAFRTLPCFKPEKAFVDSLNLNSLKNLKNSSLIQVTQLIQNYMN